MAGKAGKIKAREHRNRRKIPSVDTPTVTGRVAGIVDLDGDPDPSGYSVTVGNNATVGTVYRRIEAVSIPEVVLPIGLSQYSNPTLTQIAQGPLAPGKYTKLTTKTSSNRITLGNPDSQYPVHYQINAVDLANGAIIDVVGPVVLTYTGAAGSTLDLSNSMRVGNPDHPEWLDLRVYSGNLRVANNGALYSKVTAPNSTVLFDNNAIFTGGVAAKTLNMQNNTSAVVFSMTMAELLRQY